MDDANAVFPCPLRGLEFGCEAQPSCDEVATLKQMVIAVCDTVETPVYEVLSFVAVQLPPSLHRPHTPPPLLHFHRASLGSRTRLRDPDRSCICWAAFLTWRRGVSGLIRQSEIRPGGFRPPGKNPARRHCLDLAMTVTGNIDAAWRTAFEMDPGADKAHLGRTGGDDCMNAVTRVDEEEPKGSGDRRYRQALRSKHDSRGGCQGIQRQVPRQTGSVIAVLDREHARQ